ncbi:MAG TPA: VWA domain-containing protein, partial [Rhodopila sp.]|nr:VWA domain-containing protein [Rhodopila sp.]
TRNQLSDLAKALEDILRAGVSGRMQPQTFFAQLRNVFAQTATDPQQIAHASSLGALISEYIDDLPYQSQIMSITEQDWLTMGAIKQDEILNDIRGKLSFYREYERHPEFWKDVTHSHNEGDKVSPIPLDRLP